MRTIGGNHVDRNTALKDADDLVHDMLSAADINGDGKISFDGP
jgi:hypothetical protein